MLFTCSDNHKRDIDFGKVECLRLFCRQLLQDQEASLNYFAYGAGFKHVRESEDKVSVSSSATCILSLEATDRWKADKTQTKSLLQTLIAKKTSAGLPNDNPFTIAWILEAVTALEARYSEPLDVGASARVAEMEAILQEEVTTGEGGVKIEDYPPSAYLTQLVVRVLHCRRKFGNGLRKLVNTWAWAELTRQLALIQAKSKTADAFALAYLLMLVAAATPSSRTNPEQTSIQRAALKTFFGCQREDGTWPLSRPLFHYEKIGNAYCYEYEMLTQLLQQPELQDLLLDYLPNLGSAAESVSATVYRVEDGIQAWTSGHHPQVGDPESWATASVYHFAHSLDRLLAEAVRRQIFSYLEAPFPTLSVRGGTDADFAKDFLDSTIEVRGTQHSLRNYLWKEFVEPLAKECEGVEKGRILNKRTPRSAIFFGPPGTSKTDLAGHIAKFLGWPLLPIDPSLLLRNGMDGIQSEANAIFRMLEETERVVVLFDEFDELVRERGSSKAEPFSRLLTTAMLPKLANIRRRGTLVFIIATNNVSEFDLAIRRLGRFDRIVQIMPPTFDAKMTKKEWGLTEKLSQLGVAVKDDIKQKIEDLTFGECEEFARDLTRADAQEPLTALNSRWNDCTLQTRVSPEEDQTWRDRCKAEIHFNR